MRSIMMDALFSIAHATKALICGSNDCALAVSAYSTRGGTSGKTVRVTYPSSSKVRNVEVSIFCDTSGINCCSSLNLRLSLPALTRE